MREALGSIPAPKKKRQKKKNKTGSFLMSRRISKVPVFSLAQSLL
jgi:hypothetical protein